MARKKPATRRTTKVNRFNPVAPKALAKRLLDLGHNVRWSWEPDVQNLYARLDARWADAVQRNPIALVQDTPDHRLAELGADPSFVAQLTAAEKDLDKYLSSEKRAWFAQTAKAKQKKMRVAYFCAEFALHESFPMYSGGLGVLAGDHLKSASDLGVPLVAVGLLYRHGYYRQVIEDDGSTTPTYPPYDFDRLPITDTKKTVRLPIGKAKVTAKLWKVQVGRVPLILLDTDHPANGIAARRITHYLYGGDSEMRIKQELLLGVGGKLALDKLNLTPTVYHLNEGHAAFANLQRITEMVADGWTVEEAAEACKTSTVFTTHTPVPAGHDRFAPRLAARYLAPIVKPAKLDDETVLAMGREVEGDAKAPFCMTALALRTAGACNGVAELHGQVSREMWADFFGVAPKKVPIGHVTNGVHSPTWTAPEARHVLGARIALPDPHTPDAYDDPWAKADKVKPEELWALRNTLRAKLVRFSRQELERQALRDADPGRLAAAHTALDEHTLTIGFARRFATYKRAALLLKNPARLEAILNDADRPVQFVFAGKAHPADKPGQALLQKIVQAARSKRFAGKIVVLENYDMQIGRMMTCGSDVWLNNPLRPNEASGTSGMKPPLHGGINCSILDGWWPEGYNRRNGYVVGGEQFSSQAKQDRYDAESLYDVLEQQIVPGFYQRGRDGLPKKWLKVATESLKSIPGYFSTHRMVGEYVEHYYLPQHEA
ncbi:MAG: alpha-glucan family phosphorylase [Planctomycetota bacterium]